MRLHFVLSFLASRAACNRFECTDDSSFALQNRLPCEMWVGRNCWIAHEVLGYSAAEEAELLEACARACSSCAGAPDRQPEPRADCEDTRANHEVHGHGADPCRQWAPWRLPPSGWGRRSRCCAAAAAAVACGRSLARTRGRGRRRR